MSPPVPCRGCQFAGNCTAAGLVNRLAAEEWLEDRGFECSDFTPEYFRGIEGVFA
ncbi:MAG: hypothetical protein PHN84_12820 [Desulfuromonadaceae bacterium]|nr:hypothetical protein [Desulfuromonadaceae bacterium]MDD2856475.1 hypothetical protein [Desulfuromonadaceae bacterium]